MQKFKDLPGKCKLYVVVSLHVSSHGQENLTLMLKNCLSIDAY